MFVCIYTNKVSDLLLTVCKHLNSKLNIQYQYTLIRLFHVWCSSSKVGMKKVDYLIASSCTYRCIEQVWV